MSGNPYNFNSATRQSAIYEINNTNFERIEQVSIFAYDFPILEIVEEIKKYIPSDKRINGGFYDNVYIFKYDYCGKVEGKTANYFKVVCFDGTSDFITIYPCVEGKNLPYTDLNYLQYANANSNNRGKVLSQIDKFNRRYPNSH